MSREAVRPYLILKDEEGVFRITVRRTRFNSQGYPLVSSEKLDAGFPTMAKARAFVKEEYRAELTDIAIK